MKRILFLIVLSCNVIGIDAQLNTVLESNTTYTQSLNDVWGYTAGGREYALVGTRTGVNILDITDPAVPVDKGTATGPSSTWRDIKTYAGYAYVINESSGGLLVIDLTNLPAAITSADWSYWEPNIADLGGNLSTCHNIYIDDDGYGYLAGCNRNTGGVIYIDLFTNPGSPAYVDKAPAIYAHDVYVQDNIMYTSDIYEGEFSIYNIADKSNSIFLGSQSTPYTFTHNAWADATGDVLFTTDERSNASVASYDISDPNNIQKLDEFRPLATIGTGVVPHNVHVINDYLVISHYSDGIVIVDATDPSNLVEVGNYDTCSGNCSGTWGGYPFLPSGAILASDINTGLFVISPSYVRAARIEGTVTDASTGANLIGADVEIVAAQANATKSDLSGEYKTGIASSGTFDLEVSYPGYITKTTSVTLSNGVAEIVDVALESTVLPIDLLSFGVEKNRNSGVDLDWSIISDDEFISFEIERSINGREFKTIGKVNDSAPSLTPKSYHFTDIQAPSEILYYRLNMIDPSSRLNYSPIRTIDNSGSAGPEFDISPNPIYSNQTLRLTSKNSSLDDLDIKIFDQLGRLVQQAGIRNKDLDWQLDVSGLEPALYTVQFFTKGQKVQVKKLMVIE